MTRNTSKREFYIIIERDEDGYYIGEVPYLKACYSQGETIDELMVNMKEFKGGRVWGVAEWGTHVLKRGIVTRTLF